jgi:hypothetical protein
MIVRASVLGLCILGSVGCSGSNCHDEHSPASTTFTAHGVTATASWDLGSVSEPCTVTVPDSSYTDGSATALTLDIECTRPNDSVVQMGGDLVLSDQRIIASNPSYRGSLSTSGCGPVGSEATSTTLNPTVQVDVSNEAGGSAAFPSMVTSDYRRTIHVQIVKQALTDASGASCGTLSLDLTFTTTATDYAAHQASTFRSATTTDEP